MIVDENPECSRTVDKESSLVVATITERKADLSELLQRITHQIVKPHEVVVVCNGHITVPKEIITEYEELGITLRLIEVDSGLTLGANRNVGIKATKAKYVYFLDDDVRPTRRWLVEMKRSLEAGAEVTGGISKPLFACGINKPIWWDEPLLGPYFAVGNQYVIFRHNAIWGCNFAIRKDVVQKIGYFDESLGLRKRPPRLYGEDTEFVERAVASGLTVQFNPNAIVYHRLDAQRLNLANLRIRALREGRTMKELYRNNSCTTAFSKHLLFKAIRGLYFSFTHESKAIGLLILMRMLLFEVVGWLVQLE